MLSRIWLNENVRNFDFFLPFVLTVGGRCQNQWHRLDSTTSRVLSVMIVPCALRAMCALCVGSRQMNLGQFTIIRFWSSVDVVSDQRNVRMHMQHVIQKTDFFLIRWKSSALNGARGSYAVCSGVWVRASPKCLVDAFYCQASWFYDAAFCAYLNLELIFLTYVCNHNSRTLMFDY